MGILDRVKWKFMENDEVTGASFIWRKRELGLFSLRKRRFKEDLNAYKYLMLGSKEGTKLICVALYRTRVIQTGKKKMQFHLNIREILFYCKHDWTLQQVTQNDGGFSILINIQNWTGRVPEQPGPVDSALTMWGGWDCIQDPFQHVVLWSLSLCDNEYLALKHPRWKFLIWSIQKGPNSLKTENEIVGWYRYLLLYW